MGRRPRNIVLSPENIRTPLRSQMSECTISSVLPSDKKNTYLIPTPPSHSMIAARFQSSTHLPFVYSEELLSSRDC